MEKVDWKVDGMTCSNCALSITKFLQKKGLKEVNVNPIDGKVSFINENNTDLEKIQIGIVELGYTVASENSNSTTNKKQWLSNNKQRFFFTLPFTILLMMSISSHKFKKP